jgi:S-adenosylmethionine synthetase
MNLSIEHLSETPAEATVEVVERKGMGHPDTICDALAEEVSRALSRHYLERFGRVLHHNVDKALLCGGSASPAFGGGEVTAPIEIILAGRVTTSVGGVEVPAASLATESCRSWLRTHLHALDAERHVRIECRFRPGSVDLLDVFGRGAGGMPRANDTSIGVGFAPLSPLEQAVLEVERSINDPASKAARPELGEDVKVMGTRRESAVELTVACPLVSAHVRDAGDYAAKAARLRDDIRGRAASRLGGSVGVTLNAADDPARGRLYLTVTGTSAEAGDDGQVGRGNRVNGLITPGRPMTLEAAAGKNPVSHVGKLYNLTAGLLARDLIAASPRIAAAECLLVSRIGGAIDHPQILSVRLRTRDGGPASEHAPTIAELARARLAGLPRLTEQLVAGELTVC